ncbi:ABC transporter permease subunit [Crenobacter sp. SG2303]|uniref:ABC transporter permease subunit n=1 Tax=Crenobacter oryzisoli TaxID=3056844 RepID=A0ABT7XJL7_9NEIS|nr:MULTISPECIES: ABC transporter permease subunit [unclassified Crenobacter]MDN0073764.1 ABC transporter permease subunit [Crenobacter sp. SG2303]MDN0082748.1 ABC transporter permease subunit [Crenobacter sp. SG2305]
MVSSYLPLILGGALLSLRVALASLLLALLFGLTNASIKLFGPPWLRAVSVTYTTVIRGIPELVMMLLLFFGGEKLFNLGLAALDLPAVEFNKFAAGVLTIGFIYGAYYTETFRSAFLAVPKGQLEAGLAFGMSPWRVFRSILFPQMLRYALPGINNNWLALLKSAALVSLIGLEDMGWLAEQAGRATQQPFLFYFVVCLIYLAITATSGGAFRWLGRRYNY